MVSQMRAAHHRSPQLMTSDPQRYTARCVPAFLRSDHLDQWFAWSCVAGLAALYILPEWLAVTALGRIIRKGRNHDRHTKTCRRRYGVAWRAGFLLEYALGIILPFSLGLISIRAGLIGPVPSAWQVAFGFWLASIGVNYIPYSSMPL